MTRERNHRRTATTAAVVAMAFLVTTVLLQQLVGGFLGLRFAIGVVLPLGMAARGVTALPRAPEVAEHWLGLGLLVALPQLPINAFLGWWTPLLSATVAVVALWVAWRAVGEHVTQQRRRWGVAQRIKQDQRAALEQRQLSRRPHEGEQSPGARATRPDDAADGGPDG